MGERMTALADFPICQHNDEPGRVRLRPHPRWQNGVTTYICEECHQAELQKQDEARKRRAEELMGRWPE